MLFTVCEQPSDSMTQTHHTQAQAETGIKWRREKDSKWSKFELGVHKCLCLFVFRLFRVRGHETTLLCGMQPLEGCGNYTQILYSCRQRRRGSCRLSGDCWTELHCRLTSIMQAQGLFCEAGNELYVLFRRTNDMAYTKDVRVLLGIKVTTVSVSSLYLTFSHTSGTKSTFPSPSRFFQTSKG